MPSNSPPEELQPLREEAPWVVCEKENIWYAVRGQPSTEAVLDRRRFHTFLLRWDDVSLVAQGWLGRVDFTVVEKGVDFRVMLPEQTPSDERRGVNEVAFYVDREPDLQLCVEGRVATLFEMNEWVELELRGMRLRIRFCIVEGQGNFVGHILPGSRPNQGVEKAGCDMCMGLRTVRRSPHCCLHIEVRFVDGSIIL